MVRKEAERSKSGSAILDSLASIQLDDVLHLLERGITEEDVTEELSTQARLKRASECMIFYESHGDYLLKTLIFAQLKFMGAKATNEESLAFVRGTINGFQLLREYFEEQREVVRSERGDDNKKSEPGRAIPPVGS